MILLTRLALVCWLLAHGAVERRRRGGHRRFVLRGATIGVSAHGSRPLAPGTTANILRQLEGLGFPEARAELLRHAEGGMSTRSAVALHQYVGDVESVTLTPSVARASSSRRSCARTRAPSRCW